MRHVYISVMAHERACQFLSFSYEICRKSRYDFATNCVSKQHNYFFVLFHNEGFICHVVANQRQIDCVNKMKMRSLHNG